MSLELSEKNNLSVYIPKGCAHGFQTLTENAVVFYQMDEFFHPECARGVNYKDPSFQIEWPIKDKIISDKDASLGNFQLISPPI
jgi:dTDP-4-dehydrorhamnose 3,5-epimerase